MRTSIPFDTSLLTPYKELSGYFLRKTNIYDVRQLIKELNLPCHEFGFYVEKPLYSLYPGNELISTHFVVGDVKELRNLVNVASFQHTMNVLTFHVPCNACLGRGFSSKGHVLNREYRMEP